jgi:hypothetical protein
LKVDFQRSRVTSDGGLILVRERDERLGPGELIIQHLTGSRRGKNTQLPLEDETTLSGFLKIRPSGWQASGEDDAAELPPLPV